jgi:hypothetical protein
MRQTKQQQIGVATDCKEIILITKFSYFKITKKALIKAYPGLFFLTSNEDDAELLVT